MANYNDLITAIDSVIKTNNRREITGQLLQNVLNTMVGSLGENYQLAGFATPTTNPHQPDQNVFYVASQAGVYTQFDNIVLGDGISFLMWKNGAWTSQTISMVTQSWVQQNYVSKEWFRKVFRVYDEDGLEIVPNDMDSVVDNIKAMVGLWTNEYLSALGMGRDGGGTTQTLAQLNDVQLGTLANGDALVYNTVIHKWENKQIQTGVDMSVVWAALAANTNEQINASHLATALSGYVTTAALGTALQNYATQSWVNQNFITIEWFDKLFQLYNGTEAEANKITPNGALPVDQTQLNIEAMFGFWTKKYISSLGQGDDGTSYTTLAQLNDVAISSLADKDLLQWDYATGKWKNVVLSTIMSGYATQSWVNTQLGSYLPLSGGTLTGMFNVDANLVSEWSAIIKSPNSQVALAHSEGYGAAITSKNNNSGTYVLHCMYNSTSTALYIKDNGFVGIKTSSPNYSLHVNGSTFATGYFKDGSTDDYVLLGGGGHSQLKTINGQSIYGSGNIAITGGGGLPTTGGTITGYLEIYTGDSKTLTVDMHNSASFCIGEWNDDAMFFGRTSNVVGWIQCKYWPNATYYPISLQPLGGNVGIGTTSPSYKLHVVGDIYATGGVTSLSDIRHKKIISDTSLQVSEIASMRAVRYVWDDGRKDNSMHVGSIAQDWQQILPEVVLRANNDEGTLSLQYGVAALISAITIANKVMTHEEKIALLETRVSALEKENGELIDELNKIKAA